MKIALSTSNDFGPNGFGGGNTIVLGLALSLATENHVFIIAPFFAESVKDKLKKNGVVCITSDMKFKSLKKVCMDYKFDTILSLTSESFFTGLICLFTSTQLCIYVADPVVKKFNIKSIEGIRNIRYYFGQFFLFLTAKFFADFIFAISVYTEKELIDRWYVPSHKLIVLGCGVTDVFLRTPITEADRKVKLLSIGRIEFSQKPVNLLVQWTLGKQNLDLSILGNGSNLSDLKALIDVARCYNSVKLLSNVIGDEVLTHYDNASCVFVLSNVESFWITAYEAVSRGRLVILSDVADIQLNLGHLSTVYILRNHSFEEFDRAYNWIESQLRQKDLHLELYKNAEYIKCKFNYDIVAEKLMSALKY